VAEGSCAYFRRKRAKTQRKLRRIAHAHLQNFNLANNLAGASGIRGCGLVSSSARSTTCIRAERRRKKLCHDYGRPAARKKLGTGRVKILSRCADYLAALATLRANPD
jgi:hypothetical protein